MLSQFFRRTLIKGLRLFCSNESARSVLHTLATRLIRNQNLSLLNRSRVFNLLATCSAPEGPVDIAMPIPELPSKNLHLRMDLADGLSLQWYSWGYERYEPEVRRVLHALVVNLQNEPQQQPHAVFDVGANLGYFTLYLGALLEQGGGQGVVHAFEPSPLVFARLQRNVMLNPGLPVQLNEAAIADVTGKASLFLADEKAWGHCAASLVERGVEEQTGTVNVTVESIDHYVAEHDISRVSLIKMDCEGAEAQALMGAARTIERDHPHIVLELIPRYDDSWKDIFEHPAFQAYRKFQITPDGLVEHAKPSSSYEHRDWLFTTHPPVALLAGQPAAAAL